MSVKIDFDLSEFSSKNYDRTMKCGLDSFSLPETIFDTFLGGVENILLTK